MKKKIIIIIIFLIIIVIIGVFLYIKYKKPIAPSIKTTNKKPKRNPNTPRTPNSEYNDDSSYDGAQLIVDEAGAKMNEILSENEVRIKNLLKNRETRVCGANNIAPCDGNNSIEQSTTDPYYLTSQDPRFEKPVQCCVVNPNRNDPSKIQSAIKLATDITIMLSVNAGFDYGVDVLTKISKNKPQDMINSIKNVSNQITSKLQTSINSKNLSKNIVTKLESAIPNISKRAATKASTELLEKAATKLATKGGAEISKGLVAATRMSVQGTKLGTNLAVGASMGPVGWALFAIQAMGMILDLGDPAHYQDVLMLDTMKKTRDKTNEMINNSLKEVGLPVPQITGPTHKLPKSQPDEIPNLTNPTTLNDVLALVMNEYALTYAEGIWQNISNIEELSSTEHEEIIDKLQMIAYSYFDTIDGQDYLLKRSCEYFSGIYLNNQCSYSNKESCDNSYDWNKIKANIKSNNVEYKDDVDINYAEWRVATTDGQSACVSVDPSLRLGCEDKNLPYDYNNQVCTLSEVYCRSRGLDPVTNSDGTTDCNQSLGQNIAEMIFGVTIVRGLIQIFDAQQYNGCGPGEVDTGYLCREGCRPGYRDVAGVCWKDCGGGVDVGALCREGCRSGYRDILGVCWNDCNGGVDVGALCRDGCRSGYHDIAGVCWNNNPWGCNTRECGRLRGLFGEDWGPKLCTDCGGGDSYVPTTHTKHSYVPPTTAKDSYVPRTYAKSRKVPFGAK